MSEKVLENVLIASAARNPQCSVCYVQDRTLQPLRELARACNLFAIGLQQPSIKVEPLFNEYSDEVCWECLRVVHKMIKLVRLASKESKESHSNLSCIQRVGWDYEISHDEMEIVLINLDSTLDIKDDSNKNVEIDCEKTIETNQIEFKIDANALNIKKELEWEDVDYMDSYFMENPIVETCNDFLNTELPYEIYLKKELDLGVEYIDNSVKKNPIPEICNADSISNKIPKVIHFQNQIQNKNPVKNLKSRGKISVPKSKLPLLNNFNNSIKENPIPEICNADTISNKIPKVINFQNQIRNMNPVKNLKSRGKLSVPRSKLPLLNNLKILKSNRYLPFIPRPCIQSNIKVFKTYERNKSKTVSSSQPNSISASKGDNNDVNKERVNNADKVDSFESNKGSQSNLPPPVLCEAKSGNSLNMVINENKHESGNIESIEESNVYTVPPLLKEVKNYNACKKFKIRKKVSSKIRKRESRQKNIEMPMLKTKFTVLYLSEEELQKYRKNSQERAYFKKANLKCELCIMKFSSEQNHRRHMTEKHTEGEYTCGICEQRFMNKIELESHVIAHYVVYSCKECRCIKPVRRNMMKHVARNHKKAVSNKPKTEVNVKCKVCRMEFTQDWVLENHVANHHVPSRCEICKIVLPSKSALGNHKVKVHDMKKCTLCKKIFSKATIRAHIWTHNEARIFPCEDCGKKFISPENARAHRRWTHYKNNVATPTGVQFQLPTPGFGHLD